MLAKQLGLDAPQPGQVVRPDGSDVECCGAGAGAVFLRGLRGNS